MKQLTRLLLTLTSDDDNNNPYEKLNEVCEDSDKVLCLTNVGALLDNGGKVVMKKLRRQYERFVIVGTQTETANLLEQNPSWSASGWACTTARRRPTTPSSWAVRERARRRWPDCWGRFTTRWGCCRRARWCVWTGRASLGATSERRRRT